MLVTAQKYIESTLIGGSTCTRREIDMLRSLDRSVLFGLSQQQRRVMEAALMMVRVDDDDLAPAMQLANDAEESWPSVLDHEVSVEAILAFDIALAEVFLATGQTLRALKWANLTLAHLAETDDQRWHYRVHGLSAALSLFNGELPQARKHLRIGRAIVSEQSWPSNSTDYLHAVTYLVYGYLRCDASILKSLLARVRAFATDRPGSESLARLCEAAHLSLTGEVNAAMTIYTKIHQGIVGPWGPLPIRELALFCYAVELLRCAEPLRAINALANLVPSANHALCTRFILGAARLQMGDYAGVLADTGACVRANVRHSRWMFPAVLLLRAIAHLRSGHEDQALRISMILRSEEKTLQELLPAALSVLPRKDLNELLQFTHARDPWERYLLAKRLIDTCAMHGDELAVVHTLSERECIVAFQLRSDSTLVEISEALFVSRGTVTAQASSIYRKLGVRNRAEAVSSLERIGFFEGHPVAGSQD